MDIVVIKNFITDRCERINDTMLLSVIDGDETFAGFSSQTLYVYDYKKNYKFEVARQLPKLDIADIEYVKNNREYVVYTNAVSTGYNKILITFYSFNILDGSDRIIAKYTLDTKKSTGRLKAFVLDENNILIQEQVDEDSEVNYKLYIYRQSISKPINISIDVMAKYGIEKIIPYSGNNCVIQIGRDHSPHTYIGTILINKFISEISINIETDLYNPLDSSTDSVYIANLSVADKYIYYMKINTSDGSEQVIVYDSDTNSKRIRINSNVNEISTIESIYLVGGEPIVITRTKEAHKVIHLGTQSELMELRKGDEVLYINDTFIVMKENIRRLFWQKSSTVTVVYRYPGIYDDDKQILIENKKFLECIPNNDELLILLEEERYNGKY